MKTVSTGFENYAFCLVSYICAGNHSFAHELGHIMSARHDYYVDSTTGSPYSYNHGYLNVPGKWRTIMAYNTECVGSSSYCVRLNYWSNPDVNYKGDPMGIAEGSTNAADNRKTLNNTADTVANFRQHVTPTPTPTSTPTSTPTPTPTSTPTPTPTDTPTFSTVEFEMCSGLNLVSLPMTDTTFDTADKLLDAICGDNEAMVVWEWLYGSFGFQSWTIFDTGPGWPVDVGMPFWVSIIPTWGEDSCTWTVKGYPPEGLCYTIHPGINLITVPMNCPSLANASDLLDNIPKCTAVYRNKKEIDCDKWGFDAYLWISFGFGDFPLIPCRAYWISYSGSAPIIWC